jgi:hypothetical protein
MTEKEQQRFRGNDNEAVMGREDRKGNNNGVIDQSLGNQNERKHKSEKNRTIFLL